MATSLSNTTDYRSFVKKLSCKRIEPSKSTVSGDSTNDCSIADERVALPHLGTDLLHVIFIKAAPNPKDLVPLEAVCREWRSVMRDIVWKDLCLEHAGGLCDELGCTSKGSESPPGGWKALYKMVVYCPGSHHPTFHRVLDSRMLAGKYSWRDGLGHVELNPAGFFKGRPSLEGLHLSASFAKDEVFMSRMCSHSGAVEQCHIGYGSIVMMLMGGIGFVAPPPLAYRGIVKHFMRSRLARVTGAATYLYRKEKGSRSAAAKPGEETHQCPYCAAPVFPLSQEHFSTEYTDYDSLIDDTPTDFSEDEIDEEERRKEPVLMTGFVCLSGHIVLTGAGFPSKRSRGLIEDSGQYLELEKSVASLYWSGHIPKEDSRFRDGVEFLQALDLEQLVATGTRLTALHSNWPSFEKNGEVQLRTFTNKRWPVEAWKDPLIIVKFMLTEVPEHLRNSLHSYLLRGELELTECLELISGAFEELDERSRLHWAKKERETKIKKALKKAGFRHPNWPHPESMQTYIEGGVQSITIKQVIQHQKRAQSVADGKRPVEERQDKGKEVSAEHGGASSATGATTVGANARTEPLLREQQWDCAEPEGAEGAVPLYVSRGKVRMCGLILNGGPCENRAAKGCSSRGCGKCCASLPLECNLNKHNKAKAGGVT